MVKHHIDNYLECSAHPLVPQGLCRRGKWLVLLEGGRKDANLQSRHSSALSMAEPLVEL